MPPKSHHSEARRGAEAYFSLAVAKAASSVIAERLVVCDLLISLPSAAPPKTFDANPCMKQKEEWKK